MENQDNHRYDDIINLPNPTSKKHPRMSLYDRAAQFSPFAALTGFEASIDESIRRTEAWIDMDEDRKAELDLAFQELTANLHLSPVVSITYFIKDERKEGGSYKTIDCVVKKIDTYERTLILSDGTRIPIDYVVDLSCEPTD